MSTDFYPGAAEGEVMYRDTVEVKGGIATVETVNFPPMPPLGSDWPEGGYEYCGFESTVTLPDGTQYGNGPENDGETAAQCHAYAVEHLRSRA